MTDFRLILLDHTTHCQYTHNVNRSRCSISSLLLSGTGGLPVYCLFPDVNKYKMIIKESMKTSLSMSIMVGVNEREKVHTFQLNINKQHLLVESTSIMHYFTHCECISLQYHCEWRGYLLCIFAPTVSTGVGVAW